MQNSLVAHLSGYVSALFKDFAFTYRQSHELERDKARLLHELELRGERILTIELPALGKHFDKCLAKGLYTPSMLFLGRVAKKVQVPVFLRDLYLQIFDSEGMLLEDPSIDAIAAVRQFSSGCKKILLPTSKKGYADALKAFIDIERDARCPSLDWSSDSLQLGETGNLQFADLLSPEKSPGVSYFETTVLSAVADRISSSFGSLSIEEPEELPKHGPGVVSDIRKGTSKYQFLDWPEKLDRVFPFDLYGTTDLGWSRFDGQGLSYRNREVPSRLIAVPYDMTKPRLIAAEPSCHQWIQQLVWNQLARRMENTALRHCIRFSDQSQNQDFAVQGSIDRSFATIDLSSASDRLSCAVVERFFRKNLTILERLHAARTRWLRIDIRGFEVKHLLLKKFAAMGSAATFPVQTIVYAGVAIAAVLISKRWTVSSSSIEKAAKMVTVFGDDIIVPTYACRKTMDLLTMLGLQVNTNKTFLEGNFRESCGIEAFKGFNVTPVKVKLPDHSATTKSLSSLLQSSNNFWEKGLWNTAKWLENTFTHLKHLLPVVGVGSDIPGLSSFTGGCSAHLRSRRNSDLQRGEVRVLRSFDKTKKLPTDGCYRVFQYFIERPHADTFWESGTNGRTVADMRPGWTPRDVIDATPAKDVHRPRVARGLL